MSSSPSSSPPAAATAKQEDVVVEISSSSLAVIVRQNDADANNDDDDSRPSMRPCRLYDSGSGVLGDDNSMTRGNNGSTTETAISSGQQYTLYSHHRAYSDISPILHGPAVDSTDLNGSSAQSTAKITPVKSASESPTAHRAHFGQDPDLSNTVLMSSQQSAVISMSMAETPRRAVDTPTANRGQNGHQFISAINGSPHHSTHNRSFRPKNIQFQSLRYEVPANRRKGIRFCGDKKTILKSVNGEFRAGQLHAILGPSGAGKSTLMNVLAGCKIRHMTGTVLVNNKPRDPRLFRKMSCYIMQDDHLLPQLTVMESMMCSANLKLKESTSLKEKQSLINDILENLGLCETANIRTGNISGGQRKRLSIALELINNPPVMFLDEPTSGLDSVSCYQCVQLLKRLALGGRNIICTIHQPSAKVFEIFDTVFCMAEGQAIYDGPVSCIIPYFALHSLNCPPYHNPSDFIMEVATGDYGDVVPGLTHWIRSGQAQTEIHRLVKRSTKRSIGTQTTVGLNSSGASGMHSQAGVTCSDTAETEQPSTGSRAPSLMDSDTGSIFQGAEQASLIGPDGTAEKSIGCKTSKEQPRNFVTSVFTQFRILFIRTFVTIYRDSALTQVRLVSHVLIAILIGFLYLQVGNDASKVVSNAACMFFCTLFLNFSALMPTILTFPSEVLVFLREHLNYWYSLKAYYLAKTAADMPFQVALPIVYTMIVYFMTGQPHEFLRCFLFTTVLVLTSFVAQSLGLLISALSRAEIAVFIGPISIIPLLLFSGFLASFDTMPIYLQWVSYFSYLRYSFEGTMMAIYGFNRTGLTCDGIFASPDSPDGPPSGKYSPQRVQSCILFSHGDAVLESFSLHDVNIAADIGALIGFFVVFRLACYVALRWRVNASK